MHTIYRSKDKKTFVKIGLHRVSKRIHTFYVTMIYNGNVACKRFFTIMITAQEAAFDYPHIIIMIIFVYFFVNMLKR